MMRDSATERELERLLDRVLDGLQTTDDVQRLNEWLTADEAARCHYVRYVSLHAHLSWGRRDLPVEGDAARAAPPPPVAPLGLVDLPASAPQSLGGATGPTAFSSANGVKNESPAVAVRKPRRHAAAQPRERDVISLWEGALGLLRSRLSGTRRAAWIERAAALLICAFGAWAAHSYYSREELRPINVNVAERAAHEQAIVKQAIDEPRGAYAARIVRITSDAHWDKPSGTVDYLFRLIPGEAIHVTSGLMQLEFYSGAVVILEAPTVFVPLGPDCGRLEKGRMTGMASNGNFRVLTDSAEVIDLGTEFGVSVDGVTGTDVLVFNGEVKVVSTATGASGPNRVLAMSEGMAARIRPDGTAEYELPVVPESYSRSLAPQQGSDRTGDMSLVDVICGGSGYDDYLAGSIDPLSGRPDSGAWRQDKNHRVLRRKTDGEFHAVQKRSPIDGVFIPAPSGRHVQLDSLGNYADLPSSCAETSAPIWARHKSTVTEADDAGHDFWGTGTFPRVANQLSESQHGVVGMHPNVGMSIDLEAIRLQRHSAVVSFRSHLRNIDNYQERKKSLPAHRRLDSSKHSADFRVYVDGELRDSRLAFGREDGDALIEIPLTPTDQRMTLVSTEGEGEIYFDHVILVDPVFSF